MQISCFPPSMLSSRHIYTPHPNRAGHANLSTEAVRKREAARRQRPLPACLRPTREVQRLQQELVTEQTHHHAAQQALAELRGTLETLQPRLAEGEKARLGLEAKVKNLEEQEKIATKEQGNTQERITRNGGNVLLQLTLRSDCTLPC